VEASFFPPVSSTSPTRSTGSSSITSSRSTTQANIISRRNIEVLNPSYATGAALIQESDIFQFQNFERLRDLNVSYGNQVISMMMVVPLLPY
jgi:hypothetical protein